MADFNFFTRDPIFQSVDSDTCQNVGCPIQRSGCKAKDTCPRYTRACITTYTSDHTELIYPERCTDGTKAVSHIDTSYIQD